MQNLRINRNIINKRFRGVFTNDCRYQLYFGGSSSSKSYSVWTVAVMNILEGRSILAIRENDAHIKKSIFNEINKVINRHNLNEYFKINQTDKSIQSKISCGCLMTSGVKDVEKLKSVTPMVSNAFDTVIMEEATELSVFQFNQILLRQRGRTKFPKRAIMLFNPILRSHWIYKRFFEPLEELGYDFNNGRECLEYTDGELYIHKSTYEDNAYLEPEEIKTLEDMAIHSPEVYNVYALGNFGTFSEVVYSDNIEYINELPAGVNKLPLRIGIDHGFNDAQTCVISRYDEKNNTIYVIDAIEYRKMLVNDFADKVKELFKKHKISIGHIIYADSSHPRDNELLRGCGLNVKKVIKGASSKFAGIMFLKTKTVKVLDSIKSFKESVSKYVWKVDKNNNTLDDTEHDGSDILDAFRYSYELDSRGKREIRGKHINI